jgi:3-deoxy-D-manno-octulosonic-acid transferase
VRPTLALYRAVTGGVGMAAMPLGAALAPAGSAWRERWGRIADLDRVAGGPWIHAASLGEALAGSRWVEALLASGYRAPILVTARTRAGKERFVRELGERALASIAPIDLPAAIRAVIREAAPWRLDLVETELWPNLLVEAGRAGIPVVAVSATVSRRTASRLRALGLAGSELFEGLFVLAQTERHAERFRGLGVPADRIAVIGDLKAAPPPPGGEAAAGPASGAPSDAERDLVVFASLRPGEEDVAAAVARALRARPDAASWRFVVAPRHAAGARRASRALRAAGFDLAARAVASSDPSSVRAWGASLGSVGEGRAGLLETRGELPLLFPRTRVAVVGGSFAPFGGHNVLEPAAAGAAVVIGPHHEVVEAGVDVLRRHGACDVAAGPDEAARAVAARLEGPGGACAGGVAAAREASGAARRGLAALASWGLTP